MKENISLRAYPDLNMNANEQSEFGVSPIYDGSPLNAVASAPLSLFRTRGAFDPQGPSS